MSLLLSFDPGKNTGLAIFDWDTGELKLRTEMSYDRLTEFLSDIPINVGAIVVEDYIIRPGVGNRGHARGEAMRVIGQLESVAYRIGCTLVKQRPEVRLLAAKWAGYSVRKGHMPDDISAWLHGIYYLRQQGKYATALEREHGRTHKPA